MGSECAIKMSKKILGQQSWTTDIDAQIKESIKSIKILKNSKILVRGSHTHIDKSVPLE